jgi:formylglycine-generating enzyme required for sulfatase activity
MENSWQTFQKELENPQTPEQRRLQIGDLLASLDDPRSGVGVKAGVPTIGWLPVAPGGEAAIRRVWRSERPGEEDKITHIQHFMVEPFYIAQYLVTNAQYQAFIDAEDGFADLAWWQDMPKTYQRQALPESYTKLLNRPRAGLSWYQSVAFARWLNHRLQGLELPHPAGQGLLRVGDNAQIRLPTEWEWQWAAQHGAEARTYPWGEAKVGYANTRESGVKQAIAVGMYPHGAAACGALDMAGNLMEWCINDKANPTVIDVGSRATKGYAAGIGNTGWKTRPAPTVMMRTPVAWISSMGVDWFWANWLCYQRTLWVEKLSTACYHLHHIVERRADPVYGQSRILHLDTSRACRR